MTGLDQMTQKLEDLRQRAEELHGEHEIPMQDLLSPVFFSKHTRFGDANERFEAGRSRVEGQEAFKTLLDEEWDESVCSNTSFPD